MIVENTNLKTSVPYKDLEPSQAFVSEGLLWIKGRLQSKETGYTYSLCPQTGTIYWFEDDGLVEAQPQAKIVY